MPLRLHNTLTRKLEDFVPINPDRVGVYACGPTVYNYAHIGNGRMAVVFDLLVRILRDMYPSVLHVSNITDVDDKIMDAAKETGVEINTITKKYTDIYNSDMAALGVAMPDIQPRATDHIAEMIDIISRLIARGHAYAVSQDGSNQATVLFAVPSYKDYGILSGRSRDDQIAGARVEVAPYKKDPADFVLWKPSTSDQPGWDSPWGRGRPGWHIECSAMSEKHLGLPFDIHGGGADLKFPHHENEIAQSCCAHHNKNAAPADFARYWVHNGFVTVEGEKMSKSLFNVTLPHELLDHGIKGEAIRWALLSAHYRAPLDWSEQKIHDANKHLNDIYKLLENVPATELTHWDKTAVPQDIRDALNDDLNTPLAMTHIIQMKQKLEDPKPLIAALKLMGFLMSTPAEWFADITQKRANLDTAWIEQKIADRAAAKAAKNYALSDQIRDELLAKGIEIKDSPTGTTWDVK